MIGSWLPIRLAVLACLPLIAACTTISAERLQGQVGQTVADHLAQPTGWSVATPDDQAVRERVEQLLGASLTVERAVGIALLNNRDLRALLSRLEIARGDMVQAGLLDNPVFAVSLLSGSGGTEVEYALLANFLDLFTLAARRKMAVVQLERTRLAVADAVLDLAADVKHTYFALLADRQAMDLYRDSLELADAAAALADRQHAAGTLGTREQAVHQSMLARMTIAAQRAEAQYTAGRETLNRLLGVRGADTQWELPSGWPDPPPVLPGRDPLEQQALTLRLDLAARKAELQAVQMAVALARQTRWLSLLGISFRLKRDESGNYSRGPGVEFGLPVFNRSQGRIAALEAQRAEAEHRYAQLAIDVRAEVRAAVARLAASHSAVGLYRQRILPLADRVLAETLRLYNGMLVDVYALLEAKQMQIGALRDFVAATRDFWHAWIDLERGLGAALPRPLAGAAAEHHTDPRPAGNGHLGHDQGGTGQ
ncbi:MAG: TolC family protein [Desulfatitalea sp.]|nr:TolC family protein [Desulfatitalea sp.]